MLKNIILLSSLTILLILLMILLESKINLAAAHSDEIQLISSQETISAYVPTWSRRRKISVDKDPTFFSYTDQSGDNKKADLIAFDNWLSEKPYKCIGRRILQNREVAVVFKDLPAGHNLFSITCTGKCKNIKYAISRNRSASIEHYGLEQKFPVIWAKGAVTYIHRVNIGFVFFEDLPGAPLDQVIRKDSKLILPSDTIVIIQHWHYGVRSLFREEKKCRHSETYLHKPAIAQLYKTNIDLVAYHNIPDPVVTEKDKKIMNQLREGGQKIIKCLYKSQSGYSEYEFWYEKEPRELIESLCADPDSPFHWLGMKALTECPMTNNEAVEFRGDAIKSILCE